MVGRHTCEHCGETTTGYEEGDVLLFSDNPAYPHEGCPGAPLEAGSTTWVCDRCLRSEVETAIEGDTPADDARTEQLLRYRCPGCGEWTTQDTLTASIDAYLEDSIVVAETDLTAKMASNRADLVDSITDGE